MSEIICQSNDLYDSDNIQPSEQVQFQYIYTYILLLLNVNFFINKAGISNSSVNSRFAYLNPFSPADQYLCNKPSHLDLHCLPFCF